jgi:hypothetical protein
MCTRTTDTLHTFARQSGARDHAVARVPPIVQEGE